MLASRFIASHRPFASSIFASRSKYSIKHFTRNFSRSLGAFHRHYVPITSAASVEDNSQAVSPTEDPPPPPRSRLGKRKVAIHLGYEGTGYRGLQLQPLTAPSETIEHLLEQAIFDAGGILPTNMGNIARLGWSRSSRTDKSVHSLATVICMKLECDPDSFEEDPTGQALTAGVNEHLPPEVRVFSIQRVSGSFNARAECIRRTYHYFLPISVLTTGTSLSDTEAVETIRDAWQRFEGHNPFHNYTKRSVYRNENKESSIYRRKSKRKGSKAADSDDVDQDEEESSDVDQQGDGATLADASINAQPFSSHDGTTQGQRGYSTSALEVFENDSSRAINLEWKVEKDPADLVVKRHYRFIEQCTVSDLIAPLIPGGEPCVQLTVKGGSFMLHQIRHMVGACVVATRGKAPASLINVSLCAPARMSFPLAPGCSLVLAEAQFSPFQTSYDGKPPLVARWSGESLQLRGAGVTRQQEFCEKRLFPAINELLQGDEWANWTTSVDKLSCDEAVLAQMHEYYEEWERNKTERRERRERAMAAEKEDKQRESVA